MRIIITAFLIFALCPMFDAETIVYSKASETHETERKESEIEEIIKEVEGVITAYSSEVEQTDNSPEIMASGKRVYTGAIACPQFLEFGTEVIIDGKKYICEDRMNKRYQSGHYYDVWFESKSLAIEFGRQRKNVIIID